MKRIKALALAGAVMLAITVIAGCDEKNAPKVTRETGTKIMHETGTNITDETGTVMTEPPRTVQGEVPDELTDRGIIIRGEKIQVDSKHSYRKSAVSDIRWQYEYPVNCNLDVESTEEEFGHFLERFEHVPYIDIGSPSSNGAFLTLDARGYEAYYVQLFRTCMYTGDYSEGRIYLDGDPGCYAPVYADPSGKYILLESGYVTDEILLAFLEPLMVKVEITPSVSEPDGSFVSEEYTVLNRCLDAMHELEAGLTDLDAGELLKSDDLACIAFTDENGRVHDYFFAEGKYLIDGSLVYELKDMKAVTDVFANVDFWKHQYRPLTEAEQGLADYLNLKGPYFSFDPVYADVTGDGIDDLCTTVSGGSGIYSCYVVVYDPQTMTGYRLSDYEYYYSISLEESGDGRLVVYKSKEIGWSGDSAKKGQRGTVVIVDGELVFIAEE